MKVFIFSTFQVNPQTPPVYKRIGRRYHSAKVSWFSTDLILALLYAVILYLVQFISVCNYLILHQTETCHISVGLDVVMKQHLLYHTSHKLTQNTLLSKLTIHSFLVIFVIQSNPSPRWLMQEGRIVIPAYGRPRTQGLLREKGDFTGDYKTLRTL